MNVIHLKPCQAPNEKADVLCLGSFDGFHRGHQKLINEALRLSKGEVGVLLFSEHPGKFTGHEVGCLSDLETKIRQAELAHASICYVIDVDKEFFELSPCEFIISYLKPIDPRLLVVGSDFRFGYKGNGDIPELNDSIPTHVVDLLSDEKGKVSSTRIREDLENGEVVDAAVCLGRPFELKGIVQHGYENGRKIGFPTCNILLPTGFVKPKDGVYSGLGYISGIPYRALINVGRNPTIGKLDRPLIEAHLVDYDGNAYGKTLYLEFHERIRDEMKFSSLEELRQQITKDLKELK